MNDDFYLQEIYDKEVEIAKLQKKYKDMENLFKTIVYSMPSHRAVIDHIDVITLRDTTELIWLYDPQKKQYHFMVVRKG